MCGRVVASTPLDRLAVLFDVDEVEAPVLESRFNVAPTDEVAVVFQRAGVRRLEVCRWGLVPHWAATAEGSAFRINARAESVADKPAFRDAFARSRCLVPVDGWYEWEQRSGQPPQPWFLHAGDDGPLAFAGLHATWYGDGSSALRTCAIVTASATAQLRGIHHRMPVALPAAVWDVWLDDASPPAMLHAALDRRGEVAVGMRRVGRAVNNVRSSGAGLTEPVEQGVQGSLFA